MVFGDPVAQRLIYDMVQWISNQPTVTSKGVEISLKQQGAVCFMPPLINIARTSTPFLSNGQSYQLVSSTVVWFRASRKFLGRRQRQ